MQPQRKLTVATMGSQGTTLVIKKGTKFNDAVSAAQVTSVSIKGFSKNKKRRPGTVIIKKGKIVDEG